MEIQRKGEKMSATKSTDSLEILQTKTLDSSSKRVISLTFLLKNVSENSFESSLSIEHQLEENENDLNFLAKKPKKLSKYDELQADLNHFNLNVFGRKMSLESFRLNFRPTLYTPPPRNYVFNKNLVSFWAIAYLPHKQKPCFIDIKILTVNDAILNTLINFVIR